MKTASKRIEACRLCWGKLTDLFSLGEQYVSNFVPEADVLAGPLVPIEIVMCKGCSLVQQRYSANSEYLYRHRYWYQSAVTSTMREHLTAAAREVTEMAALGTGDLVIDIGANDGTLISSFPPGLRRVGFEPAPNFEGPPGVTWLSKFWPLSDDDMDSQRLHPKAKAITAFGMFYDLEDPQAFINGVAEHLHPDGVFVAQLMCLKQTVEQADVGNFCHEHLEFYSLKNLKMMFDRAELELFDISENDINGGSYRLWVGHKGRFPRTNAYVEARLAEGKMRLDEENTFHWLWSRMIRERGRCLEFINREVHKGKKIWVYGASTKGNVILQWYNLNPATIVAACDASPAKWGLRTPGSGIRISNHAEFRAAKPDYALVLPWAFIEEFKTFEQDWLQSGGRFLVPLPTFREVGL